MRKALASLCLLLALGCSLTPAPPTAAELDAMEKKVTVGMTYDEVVAKIGKPEADNYSGADPNGFLNYISDDRTNELKIVIENGKVTNVVRIRPGAGGE